MNKEKFYKEYRVVLGYIGVLTIFIGIITLIPLLILIAFPSEKNLAINFVTPSFLALILGYFMSKGVDLNKKYKLSLSQDAVIVVFTWGIACLFSSIPWLMSGQLNFTGAYFESVSGWTTTGLSVIDPNVTPHIYLFHRSITLFFGGVGLVLVMVSALSASFGLRLYISEGHSDRLLPNLLKSSRLIMTIYAGYILAGTLLYIFFGMNWFHAINNSIAAVSTGGFGLTADSIGEYKSLPIELVTIILMLLGATNFAANMLLFKKESFKKFFRQSEWNFSLLLIGISIPLITFSSLKTIYESLSETFRVAVFQTVSALTTTGFSTVSFKNWGTFPIFILIFLMIVGGGTNSTAGGLKQYRIYLMFKNIIWELRKKFKPSNLVNEDSYIKPDGKVFIQGVHITEASNYAFIYLVCLFTGTLILTSYGYSLQDSLFEFSSALGTVGLSVGITQITAPPVVLWAESVGMLLGRLEIYVFFIVLIKFFKDIKDNSIKISEIKQRIV